MKRILKITFSILLAFGILLFSSCGLSEEERAVREMKVLWQDIMDGEEEVAAILSPTSLASSSLGEVIQEKEDIQTCLNDYRKIDIDSFGADIPDDLKWNEKMWMIGFVLAGGEGESPELVLWQYADGRGVLVRYIGDVRYVAYSENCLNATIES